ncbi:MAG: hypothetical protein KAI47_01405, partial [Deltaproteobacteria bacterium]|nr:hypothetical protein [Deltaproteobacteria bacterium]
MIKANTRSNVTLASATLASATLASATLGRAVPARAVLTAILVVGTLAHCVGFEPTPPPRARVELDADLPAGTAVTIAAYDEYAKELLRKEILMGSAPIILDLPASRDYVALRVVVQAGQRLLKAVIPSVARGETLNAGVLDFHSTVVAQLVQEKVAGQGGSFASVPADAYVGLVAQIEEALTPPKTLIPEVARFEAITKKLLDGAKVQGEPALFHALDARLDDTYAKVAKIAAKDVTDYRAALAAVVDRLRVPIVCDASLIEVMFTVDMSGKAKDGNGVTQFIRQAPKAGKVYLAITVDETSSVPDSAGLLKPQMVPNDPDMAMVDDGTGGDEIAGDGVFTRVLVLPRGMRVKYKYTDGASGQGWTRTEEWPGNARLLEVRDVLSKSGQADCLVIRRDVFGDEATNKNHINLHTKIKAGGGNLAWNDDLGGEEASPNAEGFYSAGLGLGDVRERAPLSPAGLPETAENGICVRCPA